MERRSPVRQIWKLVVLALLAAVAAPTQMHAASLGITLGRTPAPPQAITAGQLETINYSITYETRGVSVNVKVQDPSGTTLLQRTDIIGDTTTPPPGSPRTYSAPSPLVFSPSPTAVSGRYRVLLEFTSNIGVESSANTTFDVARDLGAVRVVSFEDLNGDGVRQGAEQGIAGFRFDGMSPLSVPIDMTTEIAGIRELTGIPAGTWSFSELQQSDWFASSPTSGVAVVPPNGAGEFAVGHYKPGTLSGTVFVDTNTSATRDGGELGRSGVTLTLTGVDGKGQSVTARTVVSGADGSYRFDSLAPGTYTVTVTTPAGYTLTTTQAIGGVALTSRGEKPNIDFGIVQPPTSNPPGSNPPGSTPPTAVPVGDPEAAALRVRKIGPATAKGGQIVRYRILVTNTGRSVARQVVVSDPIPNLMTLVSTPAGAVLGNGVVTWRIGDLAAGKSRTLTMRLRLAKGAPAGVYANTATATSLNTTPVTSRTSLRVSDPPRTPTGGVTG